MIATSFPFDMVFLLHVIAAVDILIVFIAMRFAGQAVARGADASVQLAKFPSRRNWAARVLHILPVTGVILSLTGDNSLSLTKFEKRVNRLSKKRSILSVAPWRCFATSNSARRWARSHFSIHLTCSAVPASGSRDLR